jgi:hypothetical protein
VSRRTARSRPIAGMKFRTGGNRLRRAQPSRGNGGGGSTSLTSVASVTSCSKILVRAGPGAAGDPFSLSKKDPHPAGDEIFVPAGDLFPGGGLRADPEPPAHSNKGGSRHFTTPDVGRRPRVSMRVETTSEILAPQSPRLALGCAGESSGVQTRSIRWQKLPPFHLGPKLRLRPREIVACRRRRCHGSFELFRSRRRGGPLSNFPEDDGCVITPG